MLCPRAPRCLFVLIAKNGGCIEMRKEPHGCETHRGIETVLLREVARTTPLTQQIYISNMKKMNAIKSHHNSAHWKRSISNSLVARFDAVVGSRECGMWW